MEESSNTKGLRGSDEEPILQNIKSESDSEIDGGNDKNQQQRDTETGRKQYPIQSSGMPDTSTGKRSGNANEDEKFNSKKMKFEADIKKEDKSKVCEVPGTFMRNEAESNFLRLFTYVLNTVMTIKNVTDDDVSKGLRIVIESFINDSKREREQTFHEIDFSQWRNICAFLYRYASHGAGFARHRLLKAIQDCEEVKIILQKPYLKIIFLGSGAGNDAIGVCSALSEFQFPKSLKLILVDKYKEWSLCSKLAKVFIEEEDFGKLSKFFKNTRVDLSFIQTDLPGNSKYDEYYFKSLKEADVIIMSKFLSSLDRSKDQECTKSMIKSLPYKINQDAVILVNDNVFEGWWRRSGFRIIYKYDIEKDASMEKEEFIYKSTAYAEPRFGSDDNIESKLPVYVIVKSNR